MPRPVHNQGKTAITKQKSRFPLAGIFQGRKEYRKQREEEAAKVVTNDTAKNENTLVDILASINLLKSEIPKETLEPKTNPSQPYGDLEYATKAIQQQLKKSPHFEVDIREVDQKLTVLATELNNAISKGNVRAAYAAKGALLTGIHDIRNHIPAVNPKWVVEYINNVVEYLETWVQLVDHSRMADETERNLKNHEEKLALNEKKLEEGKVYLREQLTTDPKLNAAYLAVAGKKKPTAGMWSADELKARGMLVNLELEEHTLSFSRHEVKTLQLQLRSEENGADNLSVKVNSLPIPEDPNAIEKYREQIDGIIKELAKMDAKIDDTLTMLEQYNGALEELDEAPGAVHAREVIANRAEKFLEEMKANQEQEIENHARSEADLYHQLGWKNPEEMEQRKREQEQKQQEILQELNQATVDEELENVTENTNVEYQLEDMDDD
mgnify:FL=1